MKELNRKVESAYNEVNSFLSVGFTDLSDMAFSGDDARPEVISDMMELRDSFARLAKACKYGYEHLERVISLTYTYDVEFNSETSTMSKGWHATLEECQDYIRTYNGTNESYFEDFKGGVVSIRCNDTEEVVYEEDIPR